MKTKKVIIILCIVIVIGALLFWSWPKTTGTQPTSPQPQPSSTASDYKNGTYTIDGASVALVNGSAETAIAPGSASMLETNYFGNEATGNLNGAPYVAFIVTQSGGGSGTFYYIVAALESPGGYVGTNGMLLGDRIAPQTTEIKNGEIVVNFADRKPGDPMTTKPSVGVSKYFQIVNGQLTEVKG